MKPQSLSGERSSGLLMHPTSLPCAHGNGDLGRSAFDFVDFLAESGQRWWQMLPVGPPGAGPGYSPYSSYSAFAGSPWLISLDKLAEDGLLAKKDLVPSAGVRRSEPAVTERFRSSRLRQAFEVFERRQLWRDDFESFCTQHSPWLDDFALFSAIRGAQKNRAWSDWAPPLRVTSASVVEPRYRAAIREAASGLRSEVRFHQFVQFVFDRQWGSLRTYAHSRGVGLIGDIPIFVALDSADVWANPKLFLLDRTGRPKVVSGCPPDAFCTDGQLWGHPHYDWAAHRRSEFSWWVRRFESMLHRFDAVRIDHFLGFNRAWAVPAKATTARQGKWLRGPGDDLFRVVRRAIGKVPIIAEDLGAVTTEALRLRDRWKFPGMRVMQFGFGAGGEYHLPHNYPRRCVAYTGTHDNDTIVGWFKNLAERNGHVGAPSSYERRKAVRYLNVRDARQIHWSMIRAALLSPADTVIFQVQDILGLDGDARMNVPGVADGQWRWRLKDGALTDAAARKLKELTELADRNH
jgi:4-alpha-glucanotransferase